MFMVIALEANYNLLLGREWIHGIRAVPYLMHQRITIWRSDGIMENIEVGHSYFMDEVNHVDRRNFDKNLGNIGPCRAVDFVSTPLMKHTIPFIYAQLTDFNGIKRL